MFADARKMHLIIMDYNISVLANKKEVIHTMLGNTISMANKSLDYLWWKMEVVQNNLANVDTPGYKKKDVSFEEVFDTTACRIFCRNDETADDEQSEYSEKWQFSQGGKY